MSSGAELVLRADKKLRGGMMSAFFGVPYDECMDMYIQAANKFKLEKNWEGA